MLSIDITAIRADKLHLRRPSKLVVRRLRSEQIAEQFIYRDMTLYSYVLLDRTMLTDVYFRASSVGDLGQVNSSIVLSANLTLHGKLDSRLSFGEHPTGNARPGPARPGLSSLYHRRLLLQQVKKGHIAAAP